MEPQQGYLQRLADIDAAVTRARLNPDIVLERVAGLLAGRVGCRVDEAHTHLLHLATEQRRDPHELAAEMLAALEEQATAGGRALNAATETALRRPRRPAAAKRRASRPDIEPVADDWVALVQQVLDAMPGDHALLSPVRDRAGEVTDYVIVAASPAARDASGHPGTELVGLSSRETYPHMVDTPVWHACAEVLADGVPREVGPFPYAGAESGVPAGLTITIRIRRVGTAVLNSWVRHDEQTRLSERIAQTERLGNLGWGEWDLLTGQVNWSDEMYRIYERDPALGPMSTEESESLTLPEDEPIRRQAAESFGRGETVDLTFRIRIRGRIKHIRTVIDAMRDVNGRPVRVYGIVQDVTAQESSRARLAAAEEQLREHRQTLAAEHRLAAQLQEIVLPIPETAFDLPGLRVAVRYLPAEQASRVGGDWFHAAATDDGGVVLAIGDVAGHGIRAAATMAQLRHALAALAVTTTTDPADLLMYLNRLLYAQGASAGTATAVVARYQPRTGELVWAQAGHPAPLHSRAGRTTELRRPSGPLLGAFTNAAYATASATVEPGDLLLFYTDGLIEHRRHTLAEGLAPVVATLDSISASGTERPLDDLLAQLRRANPDDDTCILAVRPVPLEGAGDG